MHKFETLNKNGYLCKRILEGASVSSCFLEEERKYGSKRDS